MCELVADENKRREFADYAMNFLKAMYHDNFLLESPRKRRNQRKLIKLEMPLFSKKTTFLSHFQAKRVENGVFRPNVVLTISRFHPCIFRRSRAFGQKSKVTPVNRQRLQHHLRLYLLAIRKK